MHTVSVMKIYWKSNVNCGGRPHAWGWGREQEWEGWISQGTWSVYRHVCSGSWSWFHGCVFRHILATCTPYVQFAACKFYLRLDYANMLIAGMNFYILNFVWIQTMGLWLPYLLSIRDWCFESLLKMFIFRDFVPFSPIELFRWPLIHDTGYL